MKLSSVHYAGLAAILFENLVEDYGFVIGRADKRYTLWKYMKEDGKMTVAFVSVLSDKRSRVEMRFPGVYICEELRGEHRIVIEGRGKGKSKPATAPKTIDDFIEMPFTTLRGMKISEVTAYRWCNLANNYPEHELKWTDAYGQVFDFSELVMNKLQECECKNIAGLWYTPEQLENPKLWMYLANTTDDANKSVEYNRMCKKHGLIQLMGRWFNPIEMDDEKPWMKTARNILPAIENGNPFSFVAHFNGNGFFFGIPVEFLPEDKDEVHTYYGSSYFLKVTNKKGVKVNKRVKGKTIEVLEYEVLENGDNKPYVLVKKFNVL
jgi:hypothetical protein